MADSEQSKDFAIITNPFITGNPVRGTKVFFGREDDFVYARQRLETERQGVVLLFGGERRSGKTSILFQILDGRLGEEFLPIFIDMQAIAGVSGDREFFTNMARCTCERVQDERIVPDYYDFTQGSPTLTFDRLLDDIRQIHSHRRIVFLIDEADLLRQKMEKGELTGSLLMYMASILENRRVSFFFTGSRGLGQSTGERWRRLVGKATLRNISFLSRNDTVRLITEPVEGTVKYEEGVEDGIYRLTFGHPYYTQYICSHLVDYVNGVQKNVVTLDDIGAVTDTIIENPPPNMIYAWDELPRQEQIALSLLSEESGQQRSFVTAERLVESIGENGYPLDLQVDSLHILLENLSEREVLERDSSGAYRLRVDLFRQWISRSRSVWRLVEDVQPKKLGWPLAAGIAAAVTLVVVIVALMLMGLPKGERLRQSAAMATAGGSTTGDIWIDTDFKGRAQIQVDGGPVQAVGVPSMLSRLAPGQHVVRLKVPGHRQTADTFTVLAGRTDTLALLKEKLLRLKARLSVKSRPPNARVMLDGSPVGATPFNDSVETGERNVELRLDGYEIWTKAVSISEGAALPANVDANLIRSVGYALVESSPAGALVLIDGKELGRTPLAIDTLAVGDHDLRVVLDAHEPISRRLSVSLGRQTRLLLPLSQLPAKLQLQSEPTGAVIQVVGEGEASGVTPRALERPPGPYRIRLEKEGYEAKEFSVGFEPGRTQTQTIRLESQTGYLRIKNYWGIIVIDDAVEKDLQESSTFPLSVGTHSVKRKGGSGSIAVTITKDKTVKADVPP